MAAFVGYLLIIGIGYALRGALDNQRTEFGASRTRALTRAQARQRHPGMQGRSPGRLPAHALTRSRHAAGWWTREIAHGFPVGRTGFHAGWIANRHAATEHRITRMNAATGRLETEAKLWGQLREHRERRAKARQLILEAIHDNPDPGPSPGRARVREVAANVLQFPRRPAAATPAEQPAPETQPAQQPAANGHHNGISTLKGTTVMTTGTIQHAETTYDQSIGEADKIIRECEQRIAELRASQIIATVENLATASLDPGTLGRASEIIDSLNAEIRQCQQTIDAAVAFRDGLKRDHGNINEAHQSAPVPAAQSEFYEG